jgi:hypothetical protein
VTSSLVGPNTLPSAMFPDTFILMRDKTLYYYITSTLRCCSIGKRDQCLYILIFTFLESRQDGKNSETHGSKHSPNLLCSKFVPWVQFWLVIVVSNYLNRAGLRGKPARQLPRTPTVRGTKTSVQ